MERHGDEDGGKGPGFIAGLASLGRIGALMTIVLLVVGAGVYALLRSRVEWMRTSGALGGGVFAALWLIVMHWVLSIGIRHREVVLRLGATGPLALVAAAMPAIGGFVLLIWMDTIGTWLREQGALGLVVYVAAFMTLAGLALLPTYAQAVLGGWAFGVGFGIGGALAGFCGGALIGYAIGRAVTGDRVSGLIAEHPKWQAVRDALAGGGFWRTLGIVTLVRVPPNSPFALTNLVMAAVKVRPVPFAIGTLLGMSPRTTVAVLIGSQAQQLVAEGVDSPQSMWLRVGGIAAAIVVIVVLGKIATSAVKRASGSAPAAPADAP